jgi:hypothetical protein
MQEQHTVANQPGAEHVATNIEDDDLQFEFHSAYSFPHWKCFFMALHSLSRLSQTEVWRGPPDATSVENHLPKFSLW